jgi:hypothetical protein
MTTLEYGSELRSMSFGAGAQPGDDRVTQEPDAQHADTNCPVVLTLNRDRAFTRRNDVPVQLRGVAPGSK